jgi:hypothetical protein
VRYFRTASDEVYEQARLTLDAAWGHPDAALQTVTCIAPAAVAPRDRQGRIVLAVQDEFCSYSVAVELLPQLLAAGVVEEISEAAYRAEFPGPVPERP